MVLGEVHGSPHRIHFADGTPTEKPCSGCGVRAEVSTTTGDVQPLIAGVQSLCGPSATHGAEYPIRTGTACNRVMISYDSEHFATKDSLADAKQVAAAAADDAPPAEPGQQRLTILNLPYEIRLEIYAYLLAVPSDPTANMNSTPTLLHPNILRACRQLHSECVPVLYGGNTFLAHTSLLTAFPSLFIPPCHYHYYTRTMMTTSYAPVRSSALAALITRFRVRVRLDAEPQFDRAAATQQLSGKTEVVLEAWQAEWRGAGPDALRLFEGVRDVRVARVVGSTGGFEAYARWLERAMMTRVGEGEEEPTPYSWDDDDDDGGGQIVEGPIRG
ncbi:hypothetical protein F5Y19DRAFT_272972 [Xylariaceae sp. FL1651]|nr:hypothetical protein F5Y19DRAFT_272972 [Xylariaceae sp. FL1651]